MGLTFSSSSALGMRSAGIVDLADLGHREGVCIKELHREQDSA